MYVVVFFFKQKTAYEMRISDWSSDVCSSDLAKGSLRKATRLLFHGISVGAESEAIMIRMPDSREYSAWTYLVPGYFSSNTREVDGIIGFCLDTGSCRPRLPNRPFWSQGREASIRRSWPRPRGYRGEREVAEPCTENRG